MINLPTIWFGIVCLEVALYVLLDGADLGLGFLSLLPNKESGRSLMMQTIGPIWDANETWLVIAGGTLFGAFPLGYSIILNALYVPVMLTLFGLIIRAASFEFHALARRKRFWSLLFGLGSLLAIIGQGAALGGLLGGITISNGQFAGGPFDWVTPLTFFITLGIIVGYSAMGYAYLLKKTSNTRGWRTHLYTILLSAFVVNTCVVALSVHPYLIPGSLTITDAAASAKTLTFMLYGIVPLLPIVMAYNLYLYRVFRRGKAEHY